MVIIAAAIADMLSMISPCVPHSSTVFLLWVAAPSGFAYRLKADLTWELYEHLPEEILKHLGLGLALGLPKGPNPRTNCMYIPSLVFLYQVPARQAGRRAIHIHPSAHPDAVRLVGGIYVRLYRFSHAITLCVISLSVIYCNQFAESRRHLLCAVYRYLLVFQIFRPQIASDRRDDFSAVIIRVPDTRLLDSLH